MSKFPEILKQLRLFKNISQKKIAETLNTTDRQYRRYENGEVDPPLTFVVNIANYFDVSLDYLTGRTDNPNSHKS